MKIRSFILLAALAVTSCKTNQSSALTITKVVLGTSSGTPPVCKYDTGSDETAYPSIDPAANTGGFVGVVVQNNLLDTSTLNPDLFANSATFRPHQAVVDYEIIGGATTTNVIIPVSGVVDSSGGQSAILVPFFAPTVTATMTGTIRVTFHLEGKLDDGSTAKTTERDYIFVTCSGGATCNSSCL